MKRLALFKKYSLFARRGRADARDDGYYSSRIATVVTPMSWVRAVAGSLAAGSAMITLVMPDMSGKSSTNTKMNFRIISHPSPYYADGNEGFTRE